MICAKLFKIGDSIIDLSSVEMITMHEDEEFGWLVQFKFRKGWDTVRANTKEECQQIINRIAKEAGISENREGWDG